MPMTTRASESDWISCRSFFDPGKFLLIIVGGQLAPAQKVISGTGAGFQRLVGFRHTGRHRVQCLLRDKIRNRSQVNFDHSDSSRCSRPYRGGFHLLGSCLYFTTRCTKWEVLKPTV